MFENIVFNIMTGSAALNIFLLFYSLPRMYKRKQYWKKKCFYYRDQYNKFFDKKL